MNSFRILIIGTGRAGQARIRAAESLSEVDSIASLSIRKEGLKGVEKYLESNPVDIAIICAENGLHTILIEKALEAKAHVLVEFPLVNSSQKARELWRLAEKQGAHLLCECISLF